MSGKINEKRLVGRKVGLVTVIAYHSRDKNGSIWECVCECGNKAIFSGKRLSKKHPDVKSCGCLKRAKGKNSFAWRGHEELSGDKWGGIRRNARTREIPFLLSIQEAYNLFLSQDKRCALTGQKISLDGNDNSEYIGSLDRIDSSRPYETGNVQWVCKEINYMKMNLSQDDFIKFCKLVSSYDALRNSGSC